MNSEFREVGRLDNVCPYCEQELAMPPSQNTNCQHCAKPVISQKRPFDGQMVLLTEDQAKIVEEDWLLHQQLGMLPKIMEKSEELVYSTTAELREELGHEPTGHEVLHHIILGEMGDYYRNGKWDLFTHAFYELGELNRSNGDILDALGNYIMAYYLKSNGPRNIPLELVTVESPSFSPGTQIPEHYPMLITLMARMGSVELVPLNEFFLNCTKELAEQLNLPLSPADSWAGLEAILKAD